MKDNNGQAASSINGAISGLLFYISSYQEFSRFSLKALFQNIFVLTVCFILYDMFHNYLQLAFNAYPSGRCGCLCKLPFAREACNKEFLCLHVRFRSVIFFISFQDYSSLLGCYQMEIYLAIHLLATFACWCQR